jgi:hypothetical protein
LKILGQPGGCQVPVSPERGGQLAAAGSGRASSRQARASVAARALLQAGGGEAPAAAAGMPHGATTVVDFYVFLDDAVGHGVISDRHPSEGGL